MKHIKLISVVSAAVFAAPTVVAQTSGTGYGAPYDIIADHPQCDGSDEFALHMSFDASMLKLGQGEHQCFIVERRNGERIKRPTACSDETLAAREDIDVPPQISARLRGQLTACVSPAGKRLLDNDIVVDMRVNGEERLITLPVAISGSETQQSDINENLAHAHVSLNLGGFDGPPKLSVRVNCVHTRTEGMRITETRLNAKFEPDPEFLYAEMVFLPILSKTTEPTLPLRLEQNRGTIAHWASCDVPPES